MRKLTEQQQEYLTEHISKKPIKYLELYNELYDHYATAYEGGDDTLEATLKNLDEHFTYQKVKSINEKVLKKTQKLLNRLIWKEFKSFWKLPEILITLMVSIAVFVLFNQLDFGTSKYIFITSFSVLAILLISSYIFNRKRINGKKFTSAYIKACYPMLNLPVSLTNLSIFLPILIGDDGNRNDLFSIYPFIPAMLFILTLFSLYIAFKVYTIKVRLQFI